MINTSNRVNYLETGEGLYHGIVQAVKNVGQAFSNYINNTPTRSPRNEVTAKLFSRFTISSDNYLEVVYAIEKIALTRNYHQVKSELEVLSRAAGLTIFKYNFQAVRLGAKATLLYLHKYKLAVLPYCYRRPKLVWLDELPDTRACYSSLERSLRGLDVLPCTGRDGIPRDSEAERNRWHFSTGMRICLASSWFQPEDITMSDIRDWRNFAYASGPEQNIAIVPVINFFLKTFGKQINFTREDLSRELCQSARSLTNTTADYLKSVYSHAKSATELIDHITQDRVVLISSFSCFKFAELGIPDYLHTVGFRSPEALSYWTTAQKNFLNFKRYESPARVERAFGILNSYLFIYLPAWLAYNPNSEYIYPIQPHQFTASHYDFSGNQVTGRPLSFVEFHKKCGFIQNYNNMSFYSLLFEYIEFNLPADIHFTNPVHKLPTSRRYYTVTKNIFTPDIFPIFVEYCWALESLCSHLEFNQIYTKVITNAATKHESIKTDQLGFVPLVFVNGNNYPILEISSGALSTIRHDDLDYFYPGAIRLTLAQLETGIRTQGLQWLSSESFLNNTRRSTAHPYLLNRLFVNTDKVHPHGLIIFVLNRVLQLLKRQDQWRKTMITEHNCEMFNTKINYERRKNTKFKEISCLFAYNPQIGGPFSDNAYYSIWGYICLSFQNWYNKFHSDNLRLTALIPAKASGAKGTFYLWEDWEQSNYPDGIQIQEDNGAPYCPVALRTFVTPHGIRATFITQYSHVLDPATMGYYMTGQSAIMVGTYNKGHAALHKKLEGTLNHREPAFSLSKRLIESC